MHIALRYAEQELRHWLHERGASPPPAIADIRVDHELYREELTFRVGFCDGTNKCWRVNEEVLRRDPPLERSFRTGEFERELRSLYCRLFDDHQIERACQVERARSLEFAQHCPDAAQVHYMHRRLEERLTEIRRAHYRHPPVVVGWDSGRGEEITSFDLRPGAVNYVSGAAVSGTVVDEISTLTVEQLRAGREMIESYGRGPWLVDHWDLGRVGSPEANDKALKLLREWLSPAQLEQYEKEGVFEVIGSDTGMQYRIRYGRQMNIDQLDGQGRKVCGWCFLPEGGLAAGDVMLAQKIALENDERQALKVANRIPLPGGGW